MSIKILYLGAAFSFESLQSKESIFLHLIVFYLFDTSFILIFYNYVCLALFYNNWSNLNLVSSSIVLEKYLLFYFKLLNYLTSLEINISK